AAGDLPVAAGATGLLHVALEGRGRLVVHDVTDVGLVDAEAERAGRHHDDALALTHDPRLVLRAVLVRHLSVVPGAWDLDQAEAEPHVLDRLGGGAVDDARPGQASRELGELPELLVPTGAPDLEDQV